MILLMLTSMVTGELRSFSAKLLFGNSAKINVPRSWLGKRLIAFIHSEYIAKHPEERKTDE
jgi:hypothetical protein